MNQHKDLLYRPKKKMLLTNLTIARFQRKIRNFRLVRSQSVTGAPEAVLDWGGGGGQRPKGAHVFFLSVAHQWRSQLFGMGVGEGTKCIDLKLHIGRAEVFVIIIFLTYY